MSELEKYVKQHLSTTLRVIEQSFRNYELPNLSSYEKSIIYDYTEEGYEFENERLRNGGNLSNYGQHLTKSLKKIPNYKLLCFRVALLNQRQINVYKNALLTDSIVVERAFISSSRSIAAASVFPHNVIFNIHSKRGKLIENIAKFGINSSQNEKEVLFLSNSKFRVLDIENELGIVVITIEEV